MDIYTSELTKMFFIYSCIVLFKLIKHPLMNYVIFNCGYGCGYGFLLVALNNAPGRSNLLFIVCSNGVLLYVMLPQ